MNAHKLATTLTEDGTLLLNGLPFHAGDSVEIIILERSPEKQLPQISQTEYPLQGTVIHYDDPFEPAVTVEDWDVLK